MNKLRIGPQRPAVRFEVLIQGVWEDWTDPVCDGLDGLWTWDDCVAWAKVVAADWASWTDPGETWEARISRGGVPIWTSMMGAA